VIARPASWSERLHRAPKHAAVAAAAVGVSLFLASFALLHVGALEQNEIVDTPTYQGYGDAIVDFGAVPYRDFSLEYPPGALPAFILPALGPADDYRTLFELSMAICGAVTVVLVVATLAALNARPRRLFAAAAFVGLAPLALGTVVLTRFDLWPVALAAGALAALISGRSRLGLGVLGVAIAVKVYPAALVPLALLYVGRRQGRREAAAGLAVLVAAVAAVLVPFAILSLGGLVDSFERQAGRPLQIESLGASFLLVAHQIGSYAPAVVSSFGSQNLEGPLPDAIATIETALLALTLVGIWLLFGTTRRSSEQYLAASAAVVTAFVVFGKVLSPQFLLWLVPLVPLVAGWWGLGGCALLSLALVFTHLWFPTRYWDLVDLEALPAWLLFARDLVLAGLLAVLVAAIPRIRERARSG
jgi:Glycosyltransferase family 87